jgi:hypothetical protein
LSFLYAYSIYHQISLAIDDEENTTFIIPFGIFCYTKMAFNVKNGEATYQNVIQIILETQTGRNDEVYIDDVVVKSKRCRDLLDDLKETFGNLHKYKMKHTPKKCVFDVSLEKLLSYMVSARGSTLIQRRLKPSNNCNHPKPKEKSRS